MKLKAFVIIPPLDERGCARARAAYALTRKDLAVKYPTYELRGAFRTIGAARLYAEGVNEGVPITFAEAERRALQNRKETA